MRGLGLSKPSVSKPTPVLRAAWATNRLKLRRSCDEVKPAAAQDQLYLEIPQLMKRVSVVVDAVLDFGNTTRWHSTSAGQGLCLNRCGDSTARRSDLKGFTVVVNRIGVVRGLALRTVGGPSAVPERRCALVTNRLVRSLRHKGAKCACKGALQTWRRSSSLLQTAADCTALSWRLRRTIAEFVANLAGRT